MTGFLKWRTPGLPAALLFLSSWAPLFSESPPSPSPVKPDPAPLSDFYKSPPVPIKLLGNKKDPLAVSDPAHFQLVSDPDTRIEALLMQAQNPDDPFLFDLLAAVRKDIKFIIMLRDKDHADALWDNLKKREIPHLKNRLRFIVNEKKRIKKWARDPYTVLCNADSKQYTLIPAYQSDTHGPNWISDAVLKTEVGLQGALVRNDFTRLATWNVEGGGIVADDHYAFIGEDTVYYSRRFGEGKAVYSRDDVVRSIEKITNKKVIVLPDADMHIDRYHIPVGKTVWGERTSLLADPLALLSIIRSMTSAEKEKAIETIQALGAAYKSREFFKTPEGVDEMVWMESFLDRSDLWDFLNMTDEQFERVKKSAYVHNLNQAEKILIENGIAVVRIPALNHSYQFEEWTRDQAGLDFTLKKHFFPLGFYYTNILQDSYKGKRSVYIPRYGIKKLDSTVQKKFESLKTFHKIQPIRSVIEGTQGGGPRCRVQILGFPEEVINSSR